MEDNFELKEALTCGDCKYKTQVAYCGCHCHDEDVCLKVKKNFGSYGLDGKICNYFEAGECESWYIGPDQYEELGIVYYKRRG